MKRGTHIVTGWVLSAVVIGAFAFLSDRSGPNTSPAAADGQSPATVVPFTKIIRGSNSTVTTRVNYVITSVDELQKLWEMVDATDELPAVDFKKEVVLAVFAGEQPTTGYAISVSKVEDRDARTVSITLMKPDGDCMTGQSITAPYEIVAVPATALPFAHEDVSVTTTCAN
jgi:hypothetical protein